MPTTSRGRLVLIGQSGAIHDCDWRKVIPILEQVLPLHNLVVSVFQIKDCIYTPETNQIKAGVRFTNKGPSKYLEVKIRRKKMEANIPSPSLG